MKTTHPITKEVVRGFQVLVCKIKGLEIIKARKKDCFLYSAKNGLSACYPYFNGKEAVAVMQELKTRGFDSLAYTESAGEGENLNLEEMIEVCI